MEARGLKSLNQFVQPQHFKMKVLHTLRELVKPGDWLAKVDLKDAFLTIPMRTQAIGNTRGSKELPVQLPLFRPSVGSMGLYQDPQASSGPPRGNGSAVSSLHRQIY